MAHIDIEQLRTIHKGSSSIRQTIKQYNHTRTKKNQITRTEAQRLLQAVSRERKKLPKLVIVFGVGIICTSLFQMSALFDFEHYTALFDRYGRDTLAIRFAVSWALRFVGLFVGVGLLCRWNISRVGGLVLFGFTMCTVYWKHPLWGFKNHTRMLDQTLQKVMAQAGVQEMLSQYIKPDFFSSVALPATITAIVLDAAFAVAFIFYFTRKDIRALYQR